MRPPLRSLLVLLALCAAAGWYWSASGLSGDGLALAHGAGSRSAHRDGTTHSTHHVAGPSRADRQAAVWAADAERGIRELIGSGDGSPVGFNRRIAEWGGLVGPHWWQSALAMIALMHYAERADYRSPSLQRLLDYIYKRNIYKPRSLEKREFANQYMDDTAWWGLAWLMASEYETYVRQDAHDAARFLHVAEWDARYIASKRRCGGIEWELGSPPGTITNAEYVSLAAGISQYLQAPSVFHDPVQAARWLADARGVLRWLERTRLVNVRSGTVSDRMTSGGCGHLLGGPLAYTQGEVADALVQMGNALNDPSYYEQAARFLRYVLRPEHGFLDHGVLHEHCEALGECIHSPNRYDITAFKGIFVTAVGDWSVATGSSAFDGFLHAQAQAVIRNALAGGGGRDGLCGAPRNCQFAFSWTLPAAQTPAAERLVTVGTQESALDALTAVLR